MGVGRFQHPAFVRICSPYESIPPPARYMWRWLCYSCAIRSSRVCSVCNILDWLGLSFFRRVRYDLFVPLLVWLASFARFTLPLIVR